jgi:hypothetical protein
MKFDYTKPAADIRFLQSRDIIAASEEAAPSLIPEDGIKDDVANDNF